MAASEGNKVPPMHVEDAPTPTETAQAPIKLSLWQAMRKWPKVAGYCLALTTAILLWGYDMAMVGNLASLPQFQLSIILSSNCPCTDDSAWQARLWSAPR